MYLGQNGWFDKRWMYDVSMKSPLLMRWPNHIKPGSVNNTMVQNIDYAPTFLGVTGIAKPDKMQGIDLTPLLNGETKTLTRKSLYYHFYEYKADHTVLQHVGIRGERYKLIYFYTVNEWELYDLQKDPQEQINLAYQGKFQSLFKQLKKELMDLRNVYDDHELAGELH